MSKTKQVKVAGGDSEQNLKAVKSGAVNKPKQAKFKNTPTGKVALINGNKASNGDKKNKKNANNEKEVGKQNSEKSVTKVELADKNSPKEKNANKKKNKINLSIGKSEDESADDSVPDIFGNSLADDSDEDDTDFKEEEDDDDSDMDEEGEDEDEDDDDEDEDDDDDDDDDNDDVVQSANSQGIKKFPGVKASPKQKKQSVDDDDDEDDDDFEDDDDDNESLELDSSFKSKSGDDDDDEDDDDDTGDDDEDDEPSALGLKDLLGNSIADDDDDEDFEGAEDDDDDDDDISDAVSEDDSEGENDAETSTEKVKQTPEERLDRDKRTIYIGNIPKDTTKNQIKKEFGKFGPIEVVRVRGVIPENPKMSPKVAAITKQMHSKLKTVCVFVTYKTEESVKRALSANGTLFEGNYIRVDCAHKNDDEKPDPKKAVFLGNLPFTIDDNTIWKHFGDCGKIISVRIIRDSKSGVGRGIGYVNFATTDAAALALNLNGTKLMNREVRVKACTQFDNKKKDKEGKKRRHPRDNKKTSPKKFKPSPKKGKFDKKNKSGNAGKAVDKTNSPQEEKTQSFQGQKADGNKKQKGNKDKAKKKIIAAKLLAKPQKQSSQ